MPNDLKGNFPHTVVWCLAFVVLVYSSTSEQSASSTISEYGHQKFAWQIVCAHLSAHSKFRPKCSNAYSTVVSDTCGTGCYSTSIMYSTGTKFSRALKLHIAHSLVVRDISPLANTPILRRLSRQEFPSLDKGWETPRKKPGFPSSAKINETKRYI